MSEATVSLRKLWAVPLLLVVSTGAPAQTEARAQCDDGNALQSLVSENYETNVWFSLGRFRELEDTCESASYPSAYRGFRAQLEALIGNHAAALSYVDHAEYGDTDPEFDRDSREDFLSSFTSVPAAAYVAERARDHRIVMVNERHNAASDRLLTMELLAPLAEQGFKYLAIEAGWNGDIAVGWNGGAPINERGYPIPVTGYYVNEVVFAELVRSAIGLGYKIIAYESYGREDEQEETRAMNRQERRDWWQAKNIVTRVFDIDSGAKVLVHAGYSHIRESRTDTYAPMGHYLRQFTGLDALTVDQTEYSERSRPEFEYPLRRGAAGLGLLGEDAVVLLDAEGEPIQSREGIDFAVFGVSTRYVNGRPTWMDMGGRRRPIDFDLPECAERNCMVEARRVGFPDEVPFDRVEVVNAERTTLYLPPGEDMVVDVMGLDWMKALWRRRICAFQNAKAPVFRANPPCRAPSSISPPRLAATVEQVPLVFILGNLRQV